MNPYFVGSLAHVVLLFSWMHFDGTISIGNILTSIGIIGAILVAFNRFTVKQAEHNLTTTNAINNLSSITDGMQKAVTLQNGRIAKLEISSAVAAEVERRISHANP